MGDRFRQKINVPLVVTDEDRIVYFDGPFVLNGFKINTNPTSGALEIKSEEAPPNQPPVSVAQPASLVLDISGISIQPSSQFGPRILLESLLNSLMDTEINFEGLSRMPLRSLFNVILGRVGSVESTITDISGVRLAAEEAKTALNDITDAMQDVSGALLELRAATLQSDLSGVLVRVSALEANPPFDPTSINSSISDINTTLGTLQGVIANKADQTEVDGKASASSVSDLDARVGSAETAITSHGSRLDAVEASVPTKVAQADYDVYTAANDAAVAAKADASSLASYALSADVEAKGRLTEMESEVVSFTGINSAYWGGLIAQMRIAMSAGKLAVVDYNDGAGLSFFLGLTAAANQVFRVKNAGNHTISFNPQSDGAPAPESVEVAPSETITLLYNGSAWLLV